MPGGATSELVCSEQMAVWTFRFDEARAAGLTISQAQLYADSDVDAGLLRKLVRMGCDPGLIARIVR